MNAAAHDVEVATGRPLMPRFHGAFSVGGLCGRRPWRPCRGARAGGWGAPRLAGAAVVVTALLAARHLPDVADAPTPPLPADHAPRRVITPRLVPLGLLTACTTLGEGAAADWAAIFFTDERNAKESVAAIGYAGFAGAMAVGRLSGTWVLTHISRVSALRASGVLASLSVLALVAVDSTATGLVAMIGWGLGVALVFPAAMSAGAENADRPAQGIATVATIGYGGFLVGPPMIGFIAGAAGLGAGLFVVSLLLLLVVVLAPAARSPITSATPARDELSRRGDVSCRVRRKIARLPLRRCAPWSTTLDHPRCCSTVIAAGRRRRPVGGQCQRWTTPPRHRPPRRSPTTTAAHSTTTTSTSTTSPASTTTAVTTTTEAGPPPRSSRRVAAAVDIEKIRPTSLPLRTMAIGTAVVIAGLAIAGFVYGKVRSRVPAVATARRSPLRRPRPARRATRRRPARRSRRRRRHRSRRRERTPLPAAANP